MNDNEMMAWLGEQAKSMSIDVLFYPERIQEEHGWIRLPAAIRGSGDAYDKAIALQQIEDAWNDADGHERQQIHLIATHVVHPQREAAARKVQILMKRQYEALDAFAEADNEAEAATRFQKLRHEWAEALHELDEIAPREPQAA